MREHPIPGNKVRLAVADNCTPNFLANFQDSQSHVRGNATQQLPHMFRLRMTHESTVKLTVICVVGRTDTARQIPEDTTI